MFEAAPVLDDLIDLKLFGLVRPAAILRNVFAPILDRPRVLPPVGEEFCERAECLLAQELFPSAATCW
jgi:hypothetical protein